MAIRIVTIEGKDAVIVAERHEPAHKGGHVSSMFVVFSDGLYGIVSMPDKRLLSIPEPDFIRTVHMWEAYTF